MTELTQQNQKREACLNQRLTWLKAQKPTPEITREIDSLEYALYLFYIQNIKNGRNN